MVDLKELDIESVCGGAVIAEANRVWKDEVLPNIFDLMTKPDKKRTVILTVEITPTANREAGSVSVSAISKLAAREIKQEVFLSNRNGVARALGHDPLQTDLLDQQDEDAKVVASIPSKAGGNA